MSLVKKTYHCKVIRLTNTKQVALQQEYDNLQHYLQTREDRGLYSANKQQADRFYKVIKKTTKYPLSIRNDLIRLEHDPSNIAEYWVRIPVKLVKESYLSTMRSYTTPYAISYSRLLLVMKLRYDKMQKGSTLKA